MKEKRQQINLWSSLLLLLALSGVLFTMTACGDDEPEQTIIDYYTEVEEEFLVNGQTDHTDRYYSPVTLMKEAIRNAYSKPTTTGDDAAVIAACDELYQRYLGMYTGKAEHLTCKINLKRVSKTDDIVRSSELLKTYSFDINPYEIEE